MKNIKTIEKTTYILKNYSFGADVLAAISNLDWLNFMLHSPVKFVCFNFVSFY